ncbi:MAG: RHS repeat-associated core domain-containing protein [Deltaproteobacteria bacterium]|nr:RHS repeat-associated core domain-containing protein [Deltaproteobacteria bacterium]
MQVTTGGVTTSYAINGLGQRVSKSSTSATTIFVYDEAGHLLGEYDSAGSVIEETVWLGSLPVGVLKPGALYYVNPDHLGAPRSIIDSTGAYVWKWDRDPFGNGAPTGTLTYNLRFPGQYFDVETGLYYNMARDYNPGLGRYIQSDPIGLLGGVNTYAYVGANPITRTDPTGLLFGDMINAGECYADSAAQYWANKQVATGNPLYAIPGMLAALWTPSTSDATLGTLVAGYGAVGLTGSVANVSEWLGNPILYEFGQKTLTDAAFGSLAGLSTAERGAAIINNGLGNALFNLWGNWAKTWGTGPTPAASLTLLVGGTSEALAGGSNKNCGCQ